MQKLDLGGRHLDNYLNKILFEKGYEFTTPLEKELITEIKEKLCQVRYEGLAINKDDYKIHPLPDDSVVKLGTERFDIPEVIFDPNKIGIEQPGLHEVVFKSILKTSSDIRKDMFTNIVLAGGNTLFEGFPTRLKKEIAELAPVKANVTVHEHKERLYAAWIGGSIIGNMEGIQQLSVSKEEFKEKGVSVVHNKTF
ncbi:MAG: hypothetical protein MJ252_10580 [archaeon]|nr:hypothetical protein [archaeon]